MSKYAVKVDDNYNYMDESAQYIAGHFDTVEEAVEKCKKVTIESLEDLYEDGIDPEKLSAQWSMFGDDPFVYPGTSEGVVFSAREFVTKELCEGVIERLKGSKVLHKN